MLYIDAALNITPPCREPSFTFAVLFVNIPFSATIFAVLFKIEPNILALSTVIFVFIILTPIESVLDAFLKTPPFSVVSEFIFVPSIITLSSSKMPELFNTAPSVSEIAFKNLTLLILNVAFLSIIKPEYFLL